jgi:hypothetical protein
VQVQLAGKAPVEWAATLTDVRDQLSHLLPGGSSAVFVSTPFRQLVH